VGSYVGPNASTANSAIGVDYGRYPVTPTYSFSVGIDL
jgi:TonB-dependent starch-binding outer membrane protein SusC